MTSRAATEVALAADLYAPPVPCRRIAVVLDDSEASRVALFKAAYMARAQRATLSILRVVPPPWPTMALAGVCPDELMRDTIALAAQELRETVEQLPPDISCSMCVRAGRASAEVLRLVRAGGYDVLFVARSGRRSFSRRAVRMSLRAARSAPLDLRFCDVLS